MSAKISYKELACLLLVVSALLLVLLPACNSMPEDHKILCQQNLKNIGAALKMYAEENEGMYPPLKAKRSECHPLVDESIPLIFDVALLYPKYLSDLSVLFCPNDAENPEEKWINPITHKVDPGCVEDQSYIYLAWAADEATFNQLGKQISSVYAAALRQLLKDGDGTRRNQDWVIQKEGESIQFHRTNVGLWSASLAYSAKVPMIYDFIGASAGMVMFNHIPGGSNVLYADGHVEFVKYCVPDCSPFPVNLEMATLMGDNYTNQL